MAQIDTTYLALRELGIPAEDASYALPFGMESKMVDKRDLRNLIDMSRNRMCVRALWEYREGFDAICDGLIQYGLDNGSTEWQTIVTTQFKSKCDVLGYCPEKHGCGKYPGREG